LTCGKAYPSFSIDTTLFWPQQQHSALNQMKKIGNFANLACPISPAQSRQKRAWLEVSG
jgi:hypothetical protein